MLGIGREGLRAGFLSFLTEDDIEQIHEGALRVLTRTGIVIHHEPVLSILRKAGCRVLSEERRVYIPAPVVEQAVAQAPREVYLYTRRGEQAMALGTGPLHTRTSSGATGFVDLDSGRGQRRPSDARPPARMRPMPPGWPMPCPTSMA